MRCSDVEDVYRWAILAKGSEHAFYTFYNLKQPLKILYGMGIIISWNKLPNRCYCIIRNLEFKLRQQ